MQKQERRFRSYFISRLNVNMTIDAHRLLGGIIAQVSQYNVRQLKV
jgi:hypothetical protein